MMKNPTSAPVAKSWMLVSLPVDTDKSSYWRGTSQLLPTVQSRSPDEIDPGYQMKMHDQEKSTSAALNVLCSLQQLLICFEELL
jgi:hypothetical protein